MFCIKLLNWYLLLTFFFNSIFQFLFWYHVWCFFQTLHAWLSVFMMQLMVFIYKFNAVFDLVRQYCVINVSGSCCDGAAVSHNETFQQGQWKRLKSLFILLVMFGYIAQNRCIFPYTWCLYLKQNLINIPTVFSKRLLSLFTYRVMRWVTVARDAWRRYQGSDERFLPD